MTELPKASILHLACHGYQDMNEPLASGFIMQDKTLRVSDLMSLKLPHAFLACLSACETAKGDEKQRDQAIHLAATMLFVGFKSVVATMW
jgi:CHAT domain-containing protein